MSTLIEIEAATDTLPREELVQLLRFVTTRLRTGRQERVKSQTAPVAVGKGEKRKTARKPAPAVKAMAQWHPPAPKAMGEFLAPESQWTDLCHR